MTELLYHSDSYLKEFEATVVKNDRELNAVIFDRTAFYPGGGGQVPDSGFIRSGDLIYNLVRAKHALEGIQHFLQPGQPLPTEGSHVTGVIDWDRRYQIMRTHTAMHILCGVIFRDFGAHVTGGDMEPLKGRMDFEFESMSGELVGVINAAINKEVQAAREVCTKILPREEAFKIPDLIRTKINLLPEGITEIRTVEIVGLDLQADGGTHVKNTSEVGVMHVTDYKSKGKINKRIYVELDQ